MADENKLLSIFQRAADAGTNAAATQQSQTNVPDVRNIQGTAGASIVGVDEAARNADLEAVRRPGVALNTELGAPAATRFRLAFANDTPAQIKQLQAKYGVENIAISPAGKLVIRNLLNEDTGQVQDVVVDEDRLSAKDLLDLSGAIPEVIGTVAALRGGKAIPGVGGMTGKAGFVRDVITGSVGGQVAGGLAQLALTDTVNSLSDLSNLAGQRAKAAAADAAFNVVTAGTAATVPRMAARLRGPLSGSQTIVHTEAVDAIERLAAKTGIRYQMSIGEETGSPLVMKGEALLEKVPGGTSAMRKRKAAQEESLRGMQQHLLGQGPLPTESSIGMEAVDRLRRITGAVDERTAVAAQEAADTASKEILSAFDDMTLPSRQMFKRPVGEAIRTKATAKLAAFKDASRTLYDDVYASPGAQESIIPTAPLRTIAKEIKASLPKRTKVIETLDYDQYGGPIMRTTTGKEVLREFVPPRLSKFIDQMASGLDPKMPLNEVVQMRQIVNDAIDQADVLPGIGTRYLKQVSHALTDAIDQGVNALPDKTLAAKLTKANQFYKTERPKFERRGIVELFRDADNPGYLGDAEIVRRVASGEVSADRYFDFREFLGKDSSEFKMLKRAVLDDIYETSRITGQGGLIDAKAFVDSVKGLDREVAQDLLGNKGEQMLRSARLLGHVQGKIDSNDLDNLLSSGTPSADAVRKLISEQQAKDSHYANTVIKRFVKGEAGVESIKPEEFVSRYLDVAKSSGEIEQVMALLGGRPDITEGIQRKTLERFFATAARTPDPIDITKNIKGDPTQAVSGRTMLKALGDEQQQAKLRAVLGDETMGLLKDLVRVEAAQEVKEDVSRTVGGLIGGGILGRLMRLDFKDALDIAKYKTAAIMLANPKLRTYLTKQVAPPDTADLARTVIASGPFIQAVSEEFADESGAMAFLHNLNTALQSSAGVKQDPQGNVVPQRARDARLERMFRQAAPAAP